MRFFILLFLCLLTYYSHISYAYIEIGHRADFKRIFNGYGDENFQRLSKAINTGIDADLTDLFRKELGPLKGNHRILGHGWTLNDSIPKDVLEKLEVQYPGQKDKIINVWRKHVTTTINKTMSLTGLPKSQATALAGILYDIHLLGDWEPGNIITEHLLSPEDIKKNLVKNSKELFKNNNKIAPEIEQKLSKVLQANKGKKPAIIAQQLSDELARLDLGGKLHNTWGKHLKIKYSSARAETAATKQTKRLALRSSKQKINSLKASKQPLIKSDFIQKKVFPAIINRAGNLCVFMETPTGMTVIAISIETGIALYQHLQGDISWGELEKKVIESAIKGTSVGLASAIAITLGATPGGLAVIAISFATYEITNLCIEICTPAHLSPEDLKAFAVDMDSILEIATNTGIKISGSSVLDIKPDSAININHVSILELLKQ